MTLRDKIAGWAEPLMQRYKAIYIASEKLQDEAMDYAERQDELHRKVTGDSDLKKSLADNSIRERWSLTLSLEVQHKYLTLIENGIGLNEVLFGRSKPMLQEIYDYYEPMYAELMKLDPEKITEQTADTILTAIETRVDQLEVNYNVVRKRLTACQNNYEEMERLYKSTLN